MAMKLLLWVNVRLGPIWSALDEQGSVPTRRGSVKRSGPKSTIQAIRTFGPWPLKAATVGRISVLLRRFRSASQDARQLLKDLSQHQLVDGYPWWST